MRRGEGLRRAWLGKGGDKAVECALGRQSSCPGQAFQPWASIPETRKRRAIFFGTGVCLRVRASVRVSTISSDASLLVMHLQDGGVQTRGHQHAVIQHAGKQHGQAHRMGRRAAWTSQSLLLGTPSV